MIKQAIMKIVDKQDLTFDEAYAVIDEIMSGQTTPTQNAAFLAALSTKSAKAETTDEITGCAKAMRSKATTLKYLKSWVRAETERIASTSPLRRLSSLPQAV